MRDFEHVPVGLFGAAIGLSGLCLAWRMAHSLLGAPAVVGEAVGFLAVVVFGVVTLSYLARCFWFPDKVRAELQHPVKGSLFGTVPISVLLLAAVVRPYAPRLAAAIWLVGAIAMTAFTGYTVYRWMNHRQQVKQVTPTWFIPVAGSLSVPVMGATLPLSGARELSQLSLAVGLILAFVLFTLVFARLVFAEPLAPPAQPTLMILVAPFAVGFSAYVPLNGRIDLFATLLLYFALLLLAVLLRKMPFLVKCCPFRVAWWAVGFPLAAAAMATMRYASQSRGSYTQLLAGLVLAISTAAIGVIFYTTLVRLWKGGLTRVGADPARDPQ